MNILDEIDNLKIGESIVYHIGILSLDRSNAVVDAIATRVLSMSTANFVKISAKGLMEGVCTGELELFQKYGSDGDYEYWARRIKYADN